MSLSTIGDLERPLSGTSRAAPATAALLRLYSDPRVARTMASSHWPAVFGAARRSRTMGHLGLRLLEAGVMPSVPTPVQGHFLSVERVIRQRRQLLRWEVLELAEALSGLPGEVILLKGAAYEVQSLSLATARFAADVDLLVPQAQIAAAEDALRGRGWAAVQLSEYDERYYREWSHELPAFTHRDREVEVDLHHAISPHLSGIDRVMHEFVQASRPVTRKTGPAGRPIDRFRVLAPADQVIHAAVHTFADSDLSLRLREVMDFDWLLRRYLEIGPCTSDEYDSVSLGGSARDTRLDGLTARAEALGLGRPLWWALHFSNRWLATPLAGFRWASRSAPGAARVVAMNWLCDRSMLPGIRQHRRPAEAAAEAALLVRHHWQRMPLHRLAPHLARKALLRMRKRADASGASLARQP